MSRWVLLIIIPLLCPALTLAGAMPNSSWWDSTPWVEPDRGFNWYPPDNPPKPIKKAEKPQSIKEAKSMEELQQIFKKLKDAAMLHPTEKTVKVYLEAQNYLMDKGALFADVARRVAWQTPSVDYNNRSPFANFALLEKKEIQRKAQQSTLDNLSRDYGLMFFFREDCPYCHIQAPALKLLESYGLPVMAISLDGSVLPQFPHAKRDNGISVIVSNGEGISTTPTLYLVHRETKQAIMLGSGVLATDELVERIRVLTTTKPGQEF